MRSLVAAGVLLAAAASSAVADPRGFRWDSVVAPVRQKMPPGPYASWTPDQRTVATRALYSCAMLGVMSTDDGPPPDVARLRARYFTAACAYHAMPPDWPGRDRFADQARHFYGQLRAVEPATPDPAIAAR